MATRFTYEDQNAYGLARIGVTIHGSVGWLAFIPGAIHPSRPGESPNTMRALETDVVDAIWAAVEPLLPVVVDEHPLGCHRPPVADRLFLGDPGPVDETVHGSTSKRSWSTQNASPFKKRTPSRRSERDCLETPAAVPVAAGGDR